MTPRCTGRYYKLLTEHVMEDPTIKGTLQAINKLKKAKDLVSCSVPAELLKYGEETT